MTAQPNFRFRKYIALLLAILFIANFTSCAPTATETPTLSLPSTTSAVPATPPTETPIPTPTQTPFAPKATIKIVVHVPLSGEYSSTGTDIVRAADLAVQQLALPLNELGYKIDLVSYDDEMKVDTAVANAQEIVADSDVLCGVGHYASSIMIQASEIYHKAGLAFVAPSTTGTTVTDRGYLEVNRVIGRNDGQGVAGAKFAKAQGLTTVYIITQSWDYGKKNADNFKREADRVGLKVVGILTTNATGDFEGTVKRVMALHPDLVYYAGHVDQAGPFFREARGAGYMGAFLSIDATDAPSLLEFSGPLLVDGSGAYYTEVAAPASGYPDAAKLVEDFDNRYGAAPHMFAAQAYDATGICMTAIAEASKAKGGELPSRKDVANAIRALQDYKGITGTFTFNKKGDPIAAKYFVYKVVTVDPNTWDQNILVATFDIAPPK